MLEDSFLHQGKRKNLIALLRQKGITDNIVLAAMEKIPRHCFLDSAFSENACDDRAFSIGEGETFARPVTVGF